MRVTRRKGFYHFPLSRPFTNDPAFLLALMKYTPGTVILSLPAVSKSVMIESGILLQATVQKVLVLLFGTVKSLKHREVFFRRKG